MKLYKISITPTSNFATHLKGDTLFGQFCWAIRLSLGQKRLSTLLSEYESRPFVVISDAFAKGYLPKPTLPSAYLKENSDKKKENRKKIWLNLDDVQNGVYLDAKTDKEINNRDVVSSSVKNSLNYLTSSTGNGFDPFSLEERQLSSKDIYCLLDETLLSLDELTEVFTTLSLMGYGKKSTIGKGRFSVSSFDEVDVKKSSTTFMTLNPSVLNDMKLENLFYEPFTRFGKSGASRANTNAFKKPIVMADSGAVVVFKESTTCHYVGKAITHISTYEDIVHQGYAITLALKDLEDEK